MKILLAYIVLLLLASPVVALAGGCQTGFTSGVCNVTSDGSTASSARADVQAAVDAVASGDTVYIPTGTPEWETPIVVEDKNIIIKGPDCTLDGNGRPTSCPLTVTVTGSGSCPDGAYDATAFCFNMTTGTDGTSSAGTSVKKVSWRLHDLAITGTNAASTSHISINSGAYNGIVMGWRIDHVLIDFDTFASGARMFMIYGATFGLADHLTINTPANIAFDIWGRTGAEITAGTYACGQLLWGTALNLGSDEAVYIEDSTITFSAESATSAVTDLYNGAGVVVRYNDITYGVVYGHTGESANPFGVGRGTRKFEVYKNTFTPSGECTVLPFTMQGEGTGVIYQNQWSEPGWCTGRVKFSLFRPFQDDYETRYFGQCMAGQDSTWTGGDPPGHTHDGFVESTGWPCLDQIGRGSGVALGTAQPSVPVYVWRNGPEAACKADSGTCTVNNTVQTEKGSAGTNNAAAAADYVKTTEHSNGDKDYCIGDTKPASCGTHTNVYSAYTYPHALQGSTSATISGVSIGGATIQ